MIYYFDLKPFAVVEDSVNGDTTKCLIQSKTTLSYGKYQMSKDSAENYINDHIKEITNSFKEFSFLSNVNTDVVNERTTAGEHTRRYKEKELFTNWYYYPDYDEYRGYVCEREVEKEETNVFPIVNKTYTVTALINKSDLSKTENIHKQNSYIKHYKKKNNAEKILNTTCFILPILALILTALFVWGDAYRTIFIAQIDEYLVFLKDVLKDGGPSLILIVIYLIVGTIWDLLKVIFLLVPFALAFIAICFTWKEKFSSKIILNLLFTILAVVLVIAQTNLIFTMYL